MAIKNFILVEMRLKDHSTNQVTPVRFCSAPFNVWYDGKEFLAVGDLLNIGDLEHTYELITDGIDISLSGVNEAYRSIIEQEGFKNAPIDIWLAQSEDSNSVTAATYYHRGFAGTPVTEFDETSGTITVGFKTQSAFKNLSRVNSIMTSSLAHHQALHPKSGSTPADRFYEFSADTRFGEEVWKT